MRKGIFLGCVALALLGLAGCAPQRWERERGPGTLQLPPACPGRIGPRVTAFGDGLRAAYTFVTQGASDAQVAATAERLRAQGFFWPAGSNGMNNKRVNFVFGARILRSQADVDAEFAAACRAGSRPIYLTHVRYNLPFENNDQVRVW